MAFDLSKSLVIGVSSRALFDLSVEDEIFQTKGLAAYQSYQHENENKILSPGVAFPLVKAILGLNMRLPNTSRRAEVVIMSRNSAETSLRIFRSIEAYKLDIVRAALVSGESLTPYLPAYNVSLFLSQHEEDVEAAISAGVASAVVYPNVGSAQEEISQIRIAFDGDAVLFSEESERIYQEQGIDAFYEHEVANAKKPMADGPFAKLLRTLSVLQSEYKNDPAPPIRTALVTARSSPAHERVIQTLRAWNVNIDEAFFMGGVPKGKILKAFRPHMFFDDHKTHCDDAAEHVPTGRVPAKVRLVK
jgi:5'-nucleotidase